jgi:predicted DNA binding CopG/RHH family protein
MIQTKSADVLYDLEAQQQIELSESIALLQEYRQEFERSPDDVAVRLSVESLQKRVNALQRKLAQELEAQERREGARTTGRRKRRTQVGLSLEC